MTELLHLYRVSHLTETLRIRMSPKLYRQLRIAAKEDKREVPEFIRVSLERLMEDRNGNEKDS